MGIGVQAPGAGMDRAAEGDGPDGSDGATGRDVDETDGAAGIDGAEPHAATTTHARTTAARWAMPFSRRPPEAILHLIADSAKCIAAPDSKLSGGRRGGSAWGLSVAPPRKA